MPLIHTIIEGSVSTILAGNNNFPQSIRLLPQNFCCCLEFLSAHDANKVYLPVGQVAWREPNGILPIQTDWTPSFTQEMQINDNSIEFSFFNIYFIEIVRVYNLIFNHNIRIILLTNFTLPFDYFIDRSMTIITTNPASGILACSAGLMW